MKQYTTPQIGITQISGQDILSGSEVLIDGKELFGEQ